jgi:hypothetical protein
MSTIHILFGTSSFVKNRVLETLSGKSNFTATIPISQTTYLDGKVPQTGTNLGTMGYRIGASDRNPGEISNEMEGFVVLNQTNGKVFQTIGGQWCALGSIGNLDFLDPTLLPSWYNNIPNGPSAYRVGCFGLDESNYSGAADGYPNGFLVENQSTGNAFVVSGGTETDGVWSGGIWGTGTFSKELQTAWLENEGITYIRSGNMVCITGKAKIA